MPPAGSPKSEHADSPVSERPRRIHIWTKQRRASRSEEARKRAAWFEGERVRELSNAGLSEVEIGRAIGKSKSQVHRIIERHDP